MKGYNMNKSTMSEASTNWDVYIKECLEVAASSITPYKIITYKNNLVWFLHFNYQFPN